MTFVSTLQAGPKELAWPEIPPGMNAIQIVAIAGIVERLCGTAAAATYLAEAAAAFDKKAASVVPNYIGQYKGRLDANWNDDAATSPRQHARRS